MPQKQRPRGRLWLVERWKLRAVATGTAQARLGLRFFVKAMTHDGRALRLLVLLDEYTRECLAIRVARRWHSEAWK